MPPCWSVFGGARPAQAHRHWARTANPAFARERRLHVQIRGDDLRSLRPSLPLHLVQGRRRDRRLPRAKLLVIHHALTPDDDEDAGGLEPGVPGVALARGQVKAQDVVGRLGDQRVGAR